MPLLLAHAWLDPVQKGTGDRDVEGCCVRSDGLPDRCSGAGKNGRPLNRCALGGYSGQGLQSFCDPLPLSLLGNRR